MKLRKRTSWSTHAFIPMDLKEAGSLRGHAKAITFLLELSLGNSRSIVSGDTDGWLVWWNIDMKRPYGVWKAHENSITTLKVLNEGYLLSHSRDNLIKIWDIHNFKRFNTAIPGYAQNKSNGEKSNNETLGEYPHPDHATIPVNSLNFCNVDYNDKLLITPATIDSNNIDIYSISFSNEDVNMNLQDRLQLKRILSNFDAFKVYKRIRNLGEQFETDVTKRLTFGIVMKLLFLNRNSFIMGFESGHILGFVIKDESHFKKSESFEKPKGSSNPLGNPEKAYDITIINRDLVPELIYLNDYHCPENILALGLDQSRKEFFCGSSSKYVSVHSALLEKSATDPNDNNDKFSFYNLRHRGVADISFGSNILVVCSWDGIIRGYNKNFSRVFKCYRCSPRIHVMESNIGNDHVQKESAITKATRCLVMEPRDIKSLKIHRSSYKQLAITANSLTNKRLLFASYSDGTITMYHLKE